MDFAEEKNKIIITLYTIGELTKTKLTKAKYREVICVNLRSSEGSENF